MGKKRPRRTAANIEVVLVWQWLFNPRHNLVRAHAGKRQLCRLSVATKYKAQMQC